MSYAQGRAATSPAGAGVPPDPATLNYAQGRAQVAPPPADPEAARLQAAQASYQQLLGQALGDKLFALVTKDLSSARLLELGDQGLQAAAAAAVGAIGPIAGNQALDTAEEADAAKQFAGALAEWSRGAAAQWLQGPEGQALATKIAQFAQGHPEAVVAAALVAAAGAAAANASIPKLAKDFQVSDSVTLAAGVDLGKLRQIAVNAADLGIRYQRGEVEAALTWSTSKGEGGGPGTQKLAAKVGNKTTALSGDMTVTGSEVVINTAASHQGDGYSASGGTQTTKSADGNRTTVANATVSIGGQEKNLTGSAKYDTSSGELRLDANAVRDFGNGLKLQGGVAGSRDGSGATSATANGALNYQGNGNTLDVAGKADLTTGDLGVDAAAAHTFDKGSVSGKAALDAQNGFSGELAASRQFDSASLAGSLSGSVAYSDQGGTSAKVAADATLDNGLKMQLTALLDQAGVVKASASAEGSWGDFTGKASADLNLSTGQLEALALQLGYKDPNNLRSALIDFKRNYAGGVADDQFDVQLQIALDKLTVRGSNQAHLLDGKLQSNVAHLEGGYKLSDDVTAIAGIRHGFQDPQASSVLVDRNKGTWLEAGVQVKGVPLVVGYRPEDGSVSVGVTIPF
ncbi:MAG: hypothetical protein HY902_08135 [Deltaproteobacteria bacterium]|nr:hypothetical protein [Deltaproteobacteria bacterium]